MTRLKTVRTYSFKPMKGLTFWTLLLVGFEIATLLIWAVCMALLITGVRDDGGYLELLFGLNALAFLAILLISTVISMCWIYGASRNAHMLRPGGLASTPGWAVGWFFVPVMSLFKPYETIRDIWIASQGQVNGRYTKGSRLIAAWWVLFIIGNLVLRIADSLTPSDMSYSRVPSNFLLIAGVLCLAVSSVIFFILVKRIQKFQSISDARVAETF